MSADQAAEIIRLLGEISSRLDDLGLYIGFFCGTVFWLFMFFLVFCWRGR